MWSYLHLTAHSYFCVGVVSAGFGASVVVGTAGVAGAVVGGVASVVWGAVTSMTDSLLLERFQRAIPMDEKRMIPMQTMVSLNKK